ncbi:unnamed protein product [Owenia fusiformis]|uniref:Uncharacterized protein n=1 Tax=Owenia fusiformis TaxID=6347 RepID=A0A8J1XSE6_OWEFU|nr:unnamed protein product [Owenia fusiformis]
MKNTIVGVYVSQILIMQQTDKIKPQPLKTESGWSGYKPEDVLIEQQLPQPILQVEAGHFIAGSGNNENLSLAILHPRKIAVYSLTAVVGAVEHGSHCKLSLVYEHNLQRTAFCFCYGPFGGVKGRDFICVQSMDGTISVFEQESFAFSRFLPGALLPGPLVYLAKTDSFITVSSSRHIECYKYQVLAVATDSKTKEESQSLKSGKRVAMDWSLNIGEQALDIAVSSFPNSPVCIFVLGEHNLYCVTEFGKLRFAKKFEFNVSCFLPYKTVTEGTVNTLVGTHTNSLMVYQDITLKWAAQLQHTPVQIRLGNFGDLKGVIVSLSDEGHLDCSYLGTDPAIFMTPASESRETNYDDLDEELAALSEKIKESSKSIAAVPVAKSSGTDIEIISSVPPNLDAPSRALETSITDEDTPVPSITVTIQLKAKSTANNVNVTIHVAPPLVVDKPVLMFPMVDASSNIKAEVTFYIKSPFLPANMDVQVTATYQTPTGAPRVSQSSLSLPLKLIVKPAMPVKQAAYKITIDTNKPPVNLNDVYPDLLGESAGGPGNALGFQYFGGHLVTLLASKTSQRYRLQCDSFESIWLVVQDLVKRLTDYHASRRISDFKVSFSSNLPLQEFFEVVDQHFELRLNNEKMKELLSQRATQFRSIQKRLLTRFKDKTPAPLANLDTLLDGTYRQLLALGDAIDENSQKQSIVSNHLSCAVQLLNYIVKVWLDMSDSEFHVLQGSLTPVICDNGEVGWEEIVDTSITHLLRTCLAKSSKDQTINPAPLTMPKDTTKIKKHVALLFDRLGKGARLYIEGQQESKPLNNDKLKLPSPRNRSMGEEPSEEFEGGSTPLGEAEVPTGSKFGDKRKSPRGQGLEPLKPLNDRERKGGSKSLNEQEEKRKDLVPDLDDLYSSVHKEEPPEPVNAIGSLPPLGGSKLPPVSNLPPLGSIGGADLDENDPGGGASRFKKKRPKVPDLDDMGSTDSPQDMDELLNGLGSEKVYSL